MAQSVTTQHNDNARTGANLGETTLHHGNVQVATFGKLFDVPVDAHVYAQPLYLENVEFAPGNSLAVAYIATMNNSVYAFNARTGAVIWKREQLVPSVGLPDDHVGGGPGYADIQERIGIVSTPVISLEHQAIYVVTFSKVGGVYSHHLYALSLQDGTARFGSPRLITASVAGTGAGSRNGVIEFQSVLQNQRPALLLSQGRIYIAFASYADFGDYHGWVLAYDAGTLQPAGRVANLTPTRAQGGIWQAGQGPAADEAGNLYVISGNGDFLQSSLEDKVTLNETALGGPAAAAIDGDRLAIAWTGNEAARRLNVAFSDDGRLFVDKMTLNETSLDGPALCFGNQRLLLAWTGPDSRQRVNIMSGRDLRTFGLKVTLEESSPFAPALAVGNGRVFLAWVGLEALQRVNVMSSVDGTQWSNKVTLPVSAAVAPQLTFAQGKLQLMWVDMHTQKLLLMESANGVDFSEPLTLPWKSGLRPALLSGHESVVAWTDDSGAKPLRLASGSAFSRLSGAQTYTDTSDGSVALVRFKGQLHILWTGNEVARRLNIARVSQTPSLGDCIVKLSRDLAILDWFTPWNTADLNGHDTDLGSGGALLLPGTNLVVGGGKEGKLYLLDRDHLGGFCSECNLDTGETRIVESFQATAARNDPTAPQPAAEADGYHHIHGSPIYWNSATAGPRIYLWGEADRLRAFGFSGGQLSREPADMSKKEVITPPRSMPGAMMSLSAHGNDPATGILWASHPTNADANRGAVDGTLRALDATDLTRELWNSDQAVAERDKLGKLAKFTAPTVAGGRVYVATFSHKIAVYGLRNGVPN